MTYLLKNGNLQKLVSKPIKDPFPDIICTFMGRDALNMVVSHLDLKPSDSILLPAYLCKEVLRPFQGRAQIIFYDIQPDLTVDPEVIRGILAKNSVKMMMIINYFGFLQPYRLDIREVCDEFRVKLVEDCAHSLLTDGSGFVGDYSIYSFRKILPIPDGGGIKIRDRQAQESFDFHPAVFSNILSLLIIAKSALKIKADYISRAGFADKKQSINAQKTAIKKSDHNLQMSFFAKNGIGNLSFQDIIEQRRNEFIEWLQFVDSTKHIVPIYSDLPTGVCPLGFPVKVENRDLLRSSLRQKGIFLKAHWNLPQEVGRENVNSHAIAETSITLPLHFDWDKSEKNEIEKHLLS